MVRTRRTVVLLVFTLIGGLAGTMSAAGCADTDPKYGPPQGIRGREIDFGQGDTDPTPIPEAGPSTKSPQDAFADLFATITDKTEAKGSTCLDCHATTQTPVFMLATAEETRAKFKSLGFEKLATSRFYNKGAHTGKALKPEQKTLAQQWAAAEAGGAKGDGG